MGALELMGSHFWKCQFLTDTCEIDRISSRHSIGGQVHVLICPQVSDVTVNNSPHLCGPMFSHLLSIVKGIPSLARTGQLHQKFLEGFAKYFKT